MDRSENFPKAKRGGARLREHVRVDDIIKVDYGKVSEKDYEACKKNPRIIFKRFFGDTLKVPEVEEADLDLELLYKLIYQANQKIDRILDLLEKQGDEKYETSVSTEFVNISGSGMRFVSKQKFSVGDIIALRVSLPLTSRTGIKLLGKVVKSKKSEAGNKYDISVYFQNLSEEDQEVVIGYVFKRQRELLRLASKNP